MNIAIENDDKVHIGKINENNFKELTLFNNYKGNGDIYLSCKNFSENGLDYKYGDFEINKDEDNDLFMIFNKLHKEIAKGYKNFVSDFGNGVENIDDFEFKGLEKILSDEPEFSLYSSDSIRDNFEEKNEKQFNKLTIKRIEKNYLLCFNENRINNNDVRIRNNNIRFHMDRPSLKQYGIDMINIIHDLYADCKELKNMEYDEMFKLQQEKFETIKKIDDTNECR